MPKITAELWKHRHVRLLASDGMGAISKRTKRSVFVSKGKHSISQ